MASGLEAKSLQGVEVGGLGTGVFVIQFTPIPVHQARLLLPSTLCSCLLTGCLSPLQAQHVKQDSVLVFTAGPGAPCVWCTG